MGGLFIIFLLAQSWVGLAHYNQEQTEHNSETVSYLEYVTSGEFIEATFENWESEFLQMAAYVFLTVFLVQKGSAESKKIDEENPQDQDPRQHLAKDSPWPVKKGGFILKLYENSLSLVLALLFLLSLSLHAYGGAKVACEENFQHGQADCPSTIEYATTSKFWFESFQNWQSEFLAVFSIVVFSIFLRQRGSPESKPVAAPHSETGA